MKFAYITKHEQKNPMLLKKKYANHQMKVMTISQNNINEIVKLTL